MEKKTIEDLRQCYESINQENNFNPGDILRWKPNLRNRQAKGLFIVIQVLRLPIFDGESDSSSPYYREPLDLALGNFSDDGTFLIIHYDSRRFEHVPE